MKRILFMLLFVLVPVLGCQEEPVLTPNDDAATPAVQFDPEAAGLEVAQLAGWVITTPSSGEEATPQGYHHWVDFLGREMITNDLAHYEWRVRVGDGPFDVIGLHRIVRERRPWKPIRTRDNVMMMHGDYKDFLGCFQPGLLTDARPDEFGIAAYLAARDIDVWGIDQAWCLVPEGTSDFSFMSDWGMYEHIDNLSSAMQTARSVRRLTGNGNNKMTLLGFSGGGCLGFALVSEESQKPRGLRQVGALIPVDQGLVTDDPAYQAGSCEVVSYYDGLIDAGEYAEVNPLPLFGVAAQDDPDGPSDLIPGMTNLQAALALAVYPYSASSPAHFLAGTFDGDGLPDGLQYTNVDLWIDFLINAPPYFPNLFSHDEYLAECDRAQAPWADHLGDIETPIFYVGAGGGFAPYYDLSDLNCELTELIISLHPPEEVELDFAHIDLFTADMAPEIVWDPIVEWIRAHSNPGNSRTEPESVDAADLR